MKNIWLLTSMCMDRLEPFRPSKKSIVWYKTLSIDQKINLKELATTICGVAFEILTRLFGLKGAVSLLYEKLVLEKII